MSDIEPALTPDEWSRESVGSISIDRHGHAARLSTPDENGGIDAEDLSAAIALANAALPDSDPRKITREWVFDIRESALLALDEIEREYGPREKWGDTPSRLAAMAERAITHAAALASYLPPE